jgi:hypothetical protein
MNSIFRRHIVQLHLHHCKKISDIRMDNFSVSLPQDCFYNFVTSYVKAPLKTEKLTSIQHQLRSRDRVLGKAVT